MNWRMFWHRLKFICHKEMLATLKDKSTRFILVVPVIMQCIIFGYAATYDLNKVPYAVLDQSRSQLSSEFLARLDGTEAFERVQDLSNASQIAQSIDSGKAMLVVVIEPRFAANLHSGSNGIVQVINDGRNTMTAGVAASYIGRVVDSFNLANHNGVQAVQLETVAWYNPNLISRWSFLPGMMGMLSLVQVLILAGLSVAKEREQGTFDQLLVTPLTSLEIFIGKAIPPILIGLFQATMVLLICIFWFKIPMAGSLIALYLTLLAFMLACVGMGLSISAVSDSMQQVLVYCMVLLMPMVLLSGLATPVRNMPEALQLLTYADPLRFALDSIRRICLEGCGVMDIAFNFIPMLLVAAVALPTAIWLFRNKLV